MDDLFYGVSISGIIVGAVEVCKQLGIPTRYLPLISVLLGVLAGILLFSDIKQAILAGLAMGLSASGLFDFGKKTILGK